MENSLDAGASSIDVKLLGHGVDSIAVKDNGSGVAPKDIVEIFQQHTTSKITNFEVYN